MLRRSAPLENKPNKVRTADPVARAFLPVPAKDLPAAGGGAVGALLAAPPFRASGRLRSERATPRLLSRCQTDCRIFLLRTTTTRCHPFRTPATVITVSFSVSSDTPGSLLRGTIRSRFLLHLRCLFCREAVRGDSSVIHHQHDVSHRLDVFQWIAIQNDQIRFQARQDRTCPF